MEIFGFEIKKSESTKALETFDINKDASAETVESISSGGHVSYNFNIGNIPETDVDLIRTYRRISLAADIDQVLSEISNEVLIFEDGNAVELDFKDKTVISKSIQNKIKEEYQNIYDLLDFQSKGIDYFTSWYVDSKIFFHKIIDQNNLKDGIKKVTQIDPLKIKKVVEYPKPDKAGIYDISKIKEYYVYTDAPDGKSNKTFNLKGLVINPDSICYVDSGLYDKNANKVIGYLWKAIVPFNNLKLMEDSLVIYRIARAPERRVIYVDVGNLPKVKAEQYVKDLMNRFKNKLVYDAKTGSLSDKKNVLSIIEDYWLPRRDGGKGTEITTLPGGENLGVTEDVEYFKSKLYQALNVPMSRFKDEASPFAFGKGTEINRDEYRFKKFIDKIRNKFVTMFTDMLKTQLVLKKIIAPEDWDKIRGDITWKFAEDNNFVEFKESEVINNRLNTLTMADPLVGRYISKKWAQTKIMKMTDDEIKEVDSDNADDVPPPDQNSPTTQEPQEDNMIVNT